MKMYLSVIIILCFLISPINEAAIAQGISPEKDTSPAVINWIKENAVLLKTVEFQSPDNDIKPLANMIGNARIVGLGEGTHGTREHFLIKSRIIRSLIEEKGFNVVAIEANFAAVRVLNDYVLYGKGTPEDALMSLGTWIFNSEEVLDLVKWLRQYNADPENKRKVSICGFDFLNLYPELNQALSFLEKHDPPAAAALRDPFTSLLRLDLHKDENSQKVFDDLDERLSVEQSDQLVAAVEQVFDYYDVHKESLVKQTSTAEWKFARQHAAAALLRARNFAHVTGWFSSLGQEKELALTGRVPAAAKTLLSFLEKYDSAFAETVRPLLTAVQRPYPARNIHRNKLTANERAAWEVVADQISARLQVRRSFYKGATESDFSEMLKHAEDIRRLLAVYREYLTKPDGWLKDIRDTGLAENVAWLTENAGADSKVIVWAHNGHISHFSNDSDRTRMGDELKKRFGKQYLSVGMLFNRGSFQAASAFAVPSGTPRIRPFTVGSAIEGSFEDVFARAGMPLFVLDLRRLPASGNNTNWFGNEHPARDIGNRFSQENERDYYSTLILPKHYDLVIYTDTTTRARPTKQAIERFKIAP